MTDYTGIKHPALKAAAKRLNNRAAQKKANDFVRANRGQLKKELGGQNLPRLRIWRKAQPEKNPFDIVPARVYMRRIDRGKSKAIAWDTGINADECHGLLIRLAVAVLSARGVSDLRLCPELAEHFSRGDERVITPPGKQLWEKPITLQKKPGQP